MGGIRWQSPLNYFVLLQILFCHKFFIKKYNKNRSLDPLKMFVPSKPLDQATGLA